MTTYITWKSAYSVGDTSLDAQHKQIIGIVNDLYTAMQEGNDYEAVRPLLDRLLQYTNTHFKYEEQMMQRHEYPDLSQHKALHDHMRQRTADLRRHAGLVTGQDLLVFLKDWWVNHIQDQDKQYSPYLEVPVHS